MVNCSSQGHKIELKFYYKNEGSFHKSFDFLLIGWWSHWMSSLINLFMINLSARKLITHWWQYQLLIHELRSSVPLYRISYISSEQIQTKLVTFDNTEYRFHNFQRQFLVHIVQKMNFFLLTQKYFTLLGISSSQSKQKYPLLNGKTLKAYFCYTIAIVLFSVSFFWETYTFREYCELIFRILLPILLVSGFSITVFKMDIFFKIIDSCKAIVDKSEWIKAFFPGFHCSYWKNVFKLDYRVSKAAYIKTNQKIEKFTKFIYFFAAQVLPAIFVWPKGWSSLYNYAHSDSNGNDTLKLAYPMW